MDQLIVLYRRRIRSTTTDFFRYLYNEIDWRNRLIVIKGSKGVGKTTLLLQHIKESFPDLSKALYLSLDHIWFSSHNLLEIAEYFYTHGGTHLFLDEVHKYPNWQQEVKNIYDFYPELHIVVTGSSMLRLSESVKGDLSRRHKMYELRGLSLREFINMETGRDLQPLALDTILRDHTDIANDLASEIKILPLFEQYLKHGYYPFYREEGSGFDERLLQVIDTIISSEIPAVCNIDYGTTYKIKNLLSVIASENPFILNVSALSKRLETARGGLLRLIDMLDRGGIIRKLSSNAEMSGIGKPEKILFDNSNIIYAFGKQNVGTVRESYFASQVSERHTLHMPTQGDFLINSDVIVEVGGQNKKFKQIKDVPNSYIASDGIEIGIGAKIPLWLFGMMY